MRLRKRSPAFVPSERKLDSPPEITDRRDASDVDVALVLVPVLTVSSGADIYEPAETVSQEEEPFVGESFREEISVEESQIAETSVIDSPLKEVTVEEPVKGNVSEKESSLREESAAQSWPLNEPPLHKTNQKLILRSRTKKERKRFTGSLKRYHVESIKLAPTYKILPKREDRDESVTFKTKNPKARAKIKKVMERWEPK